MKGRPRLPLRVWLLGSHTLVLLLPLAVLVGTGALADDLRAQTHTTLRHQAALLSLFVARDLDALRTTHPDASLSQLAALDPDLDGLLRTARESTLAGIRLVDHRGIVVASSGTEHGDDLSDRPEVAAALAGAEALEVRARPPQSARQPLGSVSRRARVRLFLAAPLRLDGRTVGAVLLSRTPREEVQALVQLVPWWVAALPFVLTAGIALLAGWGFSRSLIRLEHAAHALTDRPADGLSALTKALDAPQGSRVAEVHGLAEAFRTMATRLQDRLDYISEFAGNVSHEFRTPIATLRGTTELLRDDPDMDASQRERFLDNAHAELARMERLVAGLLALARADAGIRRQPVDLDRLVRDAVEGRDAVTVTGTGGRVEGDPIALRTIVDNLLDNAATHGAPPIQAVLSSDDACVRLRIVDHGAGIAEADRPRVFDRWFTTRRGEGGTGIGLALVRALAQAHGGDVGVDSVPGRTVFTVDLPAPPSDPSHDGPRARSSSTR